MIFQVMNTWKLLNILNKIIMSKKELVDECAVLRVENRELKEELERVKESLKESEELVGFWSGDYE